MFSVFCCYVCADASTHMDRCTFLDVYIITNVVINIFIYFWCFTLFALPTSDRVVTGLLVNLLHDFLYELWANWLGYFSLRSLFSSSRFTQC